MAKLTSNQIKTALANVPDWKRQKAEIRRTFEFDGFPQAVLFVNAVAWLAEQANHHPDVDIRWNQVTLALSTHDQGGLTEKDFALAVQINQLRAGGSRNH